MSLLVDGALLAGIDCEWHAGNWQYDKGEEREGPGVSNKKFMGGGSEWHIHIITMAVWCVFIIGRYHPSTLF